MKRALILISAFQLFSFCAFAQTGHEPVTIDTRTHAVQNSVIDASSVTLTLGGITAKDTSGAVTWTLGSANGTKLGATGDKIGFLGATPVTKPTGSILTAISTLGLVATPTVNFNELSGAATLAQLPTLDAAHIPSLDASKITTGTFAKAQQHAATAYTDAPNIFDANSARSLALVALATPSVPLLSTVGTAGTTSRSYAVVAKLSDGTTGTAASPVATITTSNATLNSSNYDVVTWSAVPNATSYDVYRTATAGTPNTTGKIATSVTSTTYNDQGAAGDGSQPPISNATGSVIGGVIDKGGAVYNIRAYGARGDGITDDLPAFTAALAAIDATGGVGTIYLPAGLYYSSADIVIGNNKSIVGADRYTTSIIFPSGAGSLQLGVGPTNFFNGTLSGVTIQRNGTFPPTTGTIGIKAYYYRYAVIRDCYIENHDIGLATANDSTFLSMHGVEWDGIGTTSAWLKDCHTTDIAASQFGRSGVLNDPSSAYILFEGRTDSVALTDVTLIGQSASPAHAAFKWTNTPNPSNGDYRFKGINIEHVDAIFRSTASALQVNTLQVEDSRLTCFGKFFDFNAATTLNNIDIASNGQVVSGAASTITGAQKGRFNGNFVSGNLTFAGGDWTVSGNTFTTNATFSGSFTALAITNNTLVYNGIAPIVIDLTGATGNITAIGNIADAGAQPITLVPQQSWQAPTLTNSWVNVGSPYSSAGYRKDGAGRVWLRGQISSAVAADANYPNILFILPSGYRPTSKVVLTVVSNGLPAAVSVDTAGAVRVWAGISNIYIDFGSINFPTD